MTAPTAARASARKPRVEKTPGPDLSAFANDGGSIYVQNTLTTITVFTHRNNGEDEISEWAAAGDPEGGDIMELPVSYLRLPNFRKALQKGILQVIDADNPAVIDAVAASNAAWEAQQAAKRESDQFIEAQQPRSFSGLQCLAQEGRQRCSEFAISSSAQSVRERPPLCQRHAHLAGQYVPEELGTFTDGKPDIHWTRVSVNN